MAQFIEVCGTTFDPKGLKRQKNTSASSRLLSNRPQKREPKLPFLSKSLSLNSTHGDQILEIVFETQLDLPYRSAEGFEVLDATSVIQPEVLVLTVHDASRDYITLVFIASPLYPAPI